MTKIIKESQKKTTGSTKKTNETTKKTNETTKKTSGSIKKTTETPKKTNMLKAKGKLRVIQDQKTAKKPKESPKKTKKTAKSTKTDQIDTICVLLKRFGNEWSSKVVSHANQDSPKHFSLESASPKSPQKDQTSPLGLGLHLPLSYNSDDLEFFSPSPDHPSSDIDLFEEESSEADTETAEQPLKRSNISKTAL